MKYVVGFVLAYMLSACTSYSPKPQQPGGQVQNGWTSDRGPASIDDFEMAEDEQTKKDIEGLNEALVKGEQRLNLAKANIRRRLSQILTRSAAASALLNDLDNQVAEFAKNKASSGSTAELNLEANATYQRLQLTRELLEEVQWRASSVYVHIWKAFINPQRVGITRNSDRAKKRAADLLHMIHDSLNIYMADVRAVGMLNFRPHFQEIIESLESESQQQTQQYLDLVEIHNALDAKTSEVANWSYQQYLQEVQKMINAGKNLNDNEYKKQMESRSGNREPNTNVVVEGFQNTTGSEYAANHWALTFDDGPSSSHTKKIAEIMEGKGLKATYFWLSKLVENNATLAHDLFSRGHIIASHSIDHPNLPTLSEQKVKNQVSGSRDVIEKAIHDKGGTSYKMKYFRCPYGACWAPKSAKVQQAIKDAGLVQAYWRVDTVDWQDKNTQSVLNRIITQMKASGKGIILFHDIHPVAGNVLPLLFEHKHVKDSGVVWRNM